MNIHCASADGVQDLTEAEAPGEDAVIGPCRLLAATWSRYSGGVNQPVEQIIFGVRCSK